MAVGSSIAKSNGMLKKTVAAFVPVAALAATLVAVGVSLSACNFAEVFTTTSRDSTMTLQDRVVLGLRQALKVGIDSSAASAAKLNGYLAHKVIQIALPEDAKQALEAVEVVSGYVEPFASELESLEDWVAITGAVDESGFTSNLTRANGLVTDLNRLESVGDSVIKYMNRAAEYAAPRSVPIFKGAITDMTLNDGLSILNSGDSTAATQYLNGKTFNPLVTAYTPIVDSTLALVPLTQYWGDFRNLYNTALTRYAELRAYQTSWNNNAFVKTGGFQIDALKPAAYEPIETESLGAWTTQKALVGLFYLVGEEEREIRRDPFAYAADLVDDIAEVLEEVFGEIMDMQASP
jgi:Protein of unknown function (DUF4197)